MGESTTRQRKRNRSAAADFVPMFATLRLLNYPGHSRAWLGLPRPPSATPMSSTPSSGTVRLRLAMPRLARPTSPSLTTTSAPTRSTRELPASSSPPPLLPASSPKTSNTLGAPGVARRALNLYGSAHAAPALMPLDAIDQELLRLDVEAVAPGMISGTLRPPNAYSNHPPQDGSLRLPSPPCRR